MCLEVGEFSLVAFPFIKRTHTNELVSEVYLVGGCCIGSWCGDRVGCCVVVVDELIMLGEIYCL